MRILEKENYYNVINGYKELFVDQNRSTTACEFYKAGTDFDEIYALFLFDRDIRIIYLKYLLIIENYFKAILSHYFSKLYGHDNYLKLENFNCTSSNSSTMLKRIASIHKLDYNKDLIEIKKLSAEENVASVTRLFGDIQQEIARQMTKHNQMVCHYMTTHGYIPLWVLVNVLTFGKVTSLYLNLKEPDKIQIAKQFNINYIELHKYMSMLGFARNKCAHDERFYDIRFKQKIHTKSIPYFSKIGLTRDGSGSYLMGLDDAFAISIIYKQILSKRDFKEFAYSMDNALKKIGKQLKTISVNEVMNKLGYPTTWKNLIIL